MSAQRLFDERYGASKTATSTDLLDAYYTLSPVDTARSQPDDSPFYISEVIEASRNPKWQSVDRSACSRQTPWSGSQFVLKVWAAKHSEKPFGCCDEVVVDLQRLKCIRTSIDHEPQASERNAIFLEIGGRFYVPARDMPASESDHSEPTKVSVHSAASRNSYSYETLMAVLAAQRELCHEQQDVSGLIEKAEEICSKHRSRRDRMEQHRHLSHRLNLIREKLKVDTEEVEKLRKDASDLPKKRLSSEEGLSSFWEELVEQTSELRQDHMSLGETEESVASMAAEIRRRRKDLIAGAASILPIDSDGDAWTIRGLRLPNSNFAGHDDDQIATALGFSSHLLNMIAHYLDVPLRYPLRSMSSRSTVTDTVSEHYTGSKILPLYSKGVERIRFDYAVFLLNKDIEQLMNHLHLPVVNLRHTLANMRAIIDAVAVWKVGEDIEEEDAAPSLDISGANGAEGHEAEVDVGVINIRDGQAEGIPATFEDALRKAELSLPLHSGGGHLSDYIVL
ncbi:UV radiation resistance protein and autophagy-related subunit 14-domain-containing protein [Fimicolochytrium jonesii]|uniref:UV radiation resistance protein and autophagy-related subunit 14-domain-containing protein n=1 Tax=Fimicolochytrium jonesii TaxID=1396493 RepID=UPI0022FDBDB7|nr:UV radiation resistance protein and autophagy-related subunit 14-domain-containing protein [Fimicolochytrium jonesii]KAI8816774.1 UV radiation resistance protein and autophagy-related subunit 14-domain-containing protein [Fimicolochytrium jonesii]